MSVPVLLIIFNRPSLTRRTLQAIAAAGPERLLVAADGPRHDADVAACEAARDVVREAALPCPLDLDFAEANLGCGVRVHTAISWALAEHESVVVVEDDCLMHPGFLDYCRAMLVRYRDDERVMHVSGNNFLPPSHRLDAGASYHFSKYTHAWGWATWRRAWRHFDHSLARWPEEKANGLIERWCPDAYEQRYWHDIFDAMYQGRPDVWDYHWMFACWANGGLSAIPRVNQVSNVGSGPDATHTTGPGPYFDLPTGELGALEHPQKVVANAHADAWIFDHNFGGRAMRAADSPLAVARRQLRFLAPPWRAARRAYARLFPGS